MSQGVPQGAPTSCSVSTLCLRPLERKYDAVMYSDDGLIFFDKGVEVDKDPEITNRAYGVLQNEAKSG